MSVLIDVNLLLACAWQSHAQHAAASAWLDAQPAFHTCTMVELGFVRVSMSPGFRVSFADAASALSAIKQSAASHSLADHLDLAQLPPLARYADVTDAYLVALARANGLLLATLDDALCVKPWAVGVAFNPLSQAPAP